MLFLGISFLLLLQLKLAGLGPAPLGQDKWFVSAAEAAEGLERRPGSNEFLASEGL